MASIYNFDNELPHLLEGDKYDNDAKGEETGEEIFSWITDEDIINPIPSLDDAFALTDDITGVAATTSASSPNATDSKNMGINPSTTLEGDDDFSTLCVPDDNLATLFPFSDDDSFHADLPKSFEFVQEIEGKAVSADTISAVENALGVKKAPQFILDAPLPSRARSKRSRNPSCNWVSSSLSPTCSATSSLSPAVTITADPEYFAEISNVGRKRKSITKQVIPAGIRKCSHCEATKTPQWRAGPKGPKTLCNACGVRYKSGRLVPEYRPAASPTFTPSKHSNSHRKVLEMRKKKQVPTPFKGNTIRLKVKNYFPNEVGASISMNERVAETELEHEEDDGDNGLPGKQLRDGLIWNCDNYHV